MPSLDWIGKRAVVNHHREVPTRLLHCDGKLSFGDPDAGNLLVQGDNLEALKALLPYYGGAVKCIYIDPPYNTGNEGWIYNDNVNSPEMRAWLNAVVGKEGEDLSRHDKWLCMMYPRLRLLKDFLSEYGSIWITVDDTEGHYLKALMDDIFGRQNFVANVVWQKKFAPQNDAKLIDQAHDHIMVYARDKAKVTFNLLPRTATMDARYKNPDNDPRGPWTSDNPLRREYREYAFYEITTPAGRKVSPPPGSSWRFNRDEVEGMIADNRLWFGMNGKGVPRIKRFLSDVKDGIIPSSIWPHTDVGNTQEAKKEAIALNAEAIFETPKPERLIKRVLEISSNKGDLVLDSFLGSGTTGAVAQKMGRRYIGIEMGEHASTLCAPRLTRVCQGDGLGISGDLGWIGGGGFRFCTLGKPIFDEWGAVNEGVTFADLAAFVFFSDTGSPIPKKATGKSPLLGTFQDRAIYMLFSADTLGVADVAAGNVLTLAALDGLPLPAKSWSGQRIVYAEGCTVPPERLAAAGVVFKQVPYQLAAS